MARNEATLKPKVALTDRYMNLLSDQLKTSMRDYAHYLLMQRPTMDKDDVTEAWIEAVLQKFLEAGFLRPIDLIKAEREPKI